ncbi:transposon Tf2-6 polyprotein [Nephila pilipes]|uniref:Transposon Tf2-6 polyprotein n=1 Tax=Nephila pilipes TaxID=299642 RepID=A0A8X6TVV0_NEPPI|nr:transposon Tf2-6 polyprotein [Nephila pilipes]
MHLASSEKPLFCDVSTGTVRLYITKPFRKEIFVSIHNLSHPGGKSTQKLVYFRFVWKSMNRDCAFWSKHRIACQKFKIQRHRSELGNDPLPSTRFSHSHNEVVGPFSPI